MNPLSTILYLNFNGRCSNVIKNDINFVNVMALGSTQPLTEMSTRNLPGGKGRPARKAENLTAIYEPIV
jgi:hypothetical protein